VHHDETNAQSMGAIPSVRRQLRKHVPPPLIAAIFATFAKAAEGCPASARAFLDQAFDA
jgi:hypothetical protein